MDFNVLQDINILSLGAFDSGSNGLSRSITVQIYDRTSTSTPLAQLVFALGNTGTLEGGSRFLDLNTPLSLAGFIGTIVASGYGAGELNGNLGAGFLPITTDAGAGLLSFTGTARYGTANIFPTSIDGGPANRYAAGTFKYEAVTAVPEPGTLLLLGLGLIGIGAYGRKRKK